MLCLHLRKWKWKSGSFFLFKIILNVPKCVIASFCFVMLWGMWYLLECTWQCELRFCLQVLYTSQYWTNRRGTLARVCYLLRCCHGTFDYHIGVCDMWASFGFCFFCSARYCTRFLLIFGASYLTFDEMAHMSRLSKPIFNFFFKIFFFTFPTKPFCLDFIAVFSIIFKHHLRVILSFYASL